MLQQPSKFIMYRNFPLDLNIHSELNSFHPDFSSDMGLKLQTQRSAGTQAFLLDTCTVKAAVPTMSSSGAVHGMYDPVGDVIVQGMYDQKTQYQQQQHHHHHHQHAFFAPAAAAGLSRQQQPEARGCWFPNWQEIFQGFVTAKEGQHQKQVMRASSQHQHHHYGATACDTATVVSFAEVQRRQAHSNSTRSLDLTSASLHPLPRSPHDAVQLPGLTLELERKSHNALTASPAYEQLHLESKSRDALISCSDLKPPLSSPPINAIPYKYTIVSPSWLPPGWITEVQTRRTGATAGTRDKYYKDPVSGRRFRSRNEVFHFLQTGKGRIRKRDRQRKVIASSSFTGPHLLSHQAHMSPQAGTSSPYLLPAPQPIGFLLGSFVDRHPRHAGVSHPSVPTTTMTEEIAVPFVSPTIRSKPSDMLGLKRPADGRAEKLPIYKKAKSVSPKKCEDKKASRLWQWLQKPVVRINDEPEKQDMQKSDEQMKASEMEDQRNTVMLQRKVQVAQRTAQLGWEIEAAQRTMMFLSKEMQATVEKLSREIRAVQKDIMLSDEFKDGANSGREMQAAHRANGAMRNVINAAERLHGATENVTQATQNLVVATRIVVHATQRHDAEMDSQAKQPLAGMSSVIQEASRPHVGASMDAATKMPDVTMEFVSQAGQRSIIAAGCAADVTQRSDIMRNYVTEPAQMSNSAIQGARVPEVAMFSAVNTAQFPAVMRYAANQVAQSRDAVTSIVDVNHRSSVDVVGLGKDTHAYQKAVELSNQIVEARSWCMRNKKFAALNPKLDLSLLSTSLSRHQRAKTIQRIKAKHERDLLVILGRQLCHKALWEGCHEDMLRPSGDDIFGCQP